MKATSAPFVRALLTATAAAHLWAGIAAGAEPARHAVQAPAGRDDGTELARLWLARHNALNDRLLEGGVDLLFVGDSITHYWEPSPLWQRHGGDVWEKYYGALDAVNLGLAGDNTRYLLWRLEHSDFSRVSPRVAVVNIGTNDHPFATAEEAAEGIVAVVEKLRTKLPRTRILLLGIFPRGEKADDPARRFVAEASRLSSRVADGDMVHYLDIGGEFLDAEGTLSAELMPDFLHLSEKGYEVWARAIAAKLEELMGE